MSARGPVAPALIGAGVLLVAFNMRPALTTVGPLLHAIQDATGLSATGAAVLTTLPVLFLGLSAAAGPWTSRRLGADRGVLLATLLVGLGLGLRAFGGLPTLFAGAALSASGIGLAGVLLPGLVKRDFPTRIGLLTGLYTMMLCLGAAAGSGLTVPLSAALGGSWSAALAIWSLPAFAAALAWSPVAARASPLSPGAPRTPAVPVRLWRDPLAWQVTGYMGFQSALAYIMFGWAPAILQDRGLDPLEAGLIASLMSIGQAPAALGVPMLAGRLRDQRLLAGIILGLIAACFLATLYGPVALIGPAVAGLGVGLGGCFGLGLTVLVLRARDVASAGALSAMAQGAGYCIAALGPFAFGLARDSGRPGLPALLYCGIVLAAALCALGAGRDRFVGGTRRLAP
ncbi:MFS transporter [Methylobacterium sp. sgz302541]|uniref:MFS transporter n=1 Tax=unclassified Methylobacterium TaxID=2615210 RepID=UPI003D32CA44